MLQVIKRFRVLRSFQLLTLLFTWFLSNFSLSAYISNKIHISAFQMVECWFLQINDICPRKRDRQPHEISLKFVLMCMQALSGIVGRKLIIGEMQSRVSRKKSWHGFMNPCGMGQSCGFTFCQIQWTRDCKPCSMVARLRWVQNTC